MLKEVHTKQNTNEPSVHLVEDEGKKHVGESVSQREDVLPVWMIKTMSDGDSKKAGAKRVIWTKEGMKIKDCGNGSSTQGEEEK